MAGREPKLRSSVNMWSMLGFETTSSLSSIVKPSSVTAFRGGDCGSETVAPTASGNSSMSILLSAATARTSPCTFGGVPGGDGGTSVWVGTRLNSPLNRACQSSLCTNGLATPGGPHTCTGRCGRTVGVCCMCADIGAGLGGSLTLGGGGGSLTLGCCTLPLLTGWSDVSGGGGDCSIAEGTTPGSGPVGKLT